MEDFLAGHGCPDVDVYYYKTTKIGDSMGNCNTVAKKLRRRRDKCAELRMRMMVVLTRCSSSSLVSVFSVVVRTDFWTMPRSFCALIKDAFAPRLVFFFFFWINYVVELLGHGVLDQL